MHDTLAYIKKSGDFPAIKRHQLEILQLNLGYLCNLSCLHCHVNASPKRTELMSRETIDLVFTFALKHGVYRFDLTGGAPEMNPEFNYLIERATKEGIKIIDRCNLVILEETGYEGLALFLAKHKVECVASLPCYLEDNVDKQRGKGTFNQSIAALKRLNALGYGQEKSGLILNLVFNPQGASLPPSQQALEKQYKLQLKKMGIIFNQLFTITNLPIQRFGSLLISKGKFDSYMQLLKDNHQAENLTRLMCLNTLSIDWQGFVYDCDFNQMLELPLGSNNIGKIHLNQLRDNLKSQSVNTLAHCYGCTAGQGSSCGGALE